MKQFKIFYLLLSLALITPASVFADEESLKLTCEDFTWSDVQTLVAPYLDASLHTALVMQGQSSEYKVSAALDNIPREELPEVIQKILTALGKANC